MPARTPGCRPSSTGTRTTTSRPTQLAEAHERFVSEFGLNIVGGCCGTTPEHLRAVVERGRNGSCTGRRAPESRARLLVDLLARAVPPGASYLAVGERTNANGSKQFRDAMLASDWDTCVQMAREQVKEGAHVLDVCVDYVGRDGTVDMDEIAGRFATQAPLPLVFDSTEPQVVEAGLQHHGGKAILNSANLEEGEARASAWTACSSLAREYGAAVICLTIDEEGQARTADWKLRRRVAASTTSRRPQYGLEPTDLIFDCLTFPLCSGDDDLRRDAMETIEAIRRIKAELPGVVDDPRRVERVASASSRRRATCSTACSCTSARKPASTPRSCTRRASCRCTGSTTTSARSRLDLIYDRRRDGYDPLTEFMALFEGVEAGAIEQEDRSGWPVAERLKHRIIDGDRDGLEADLDEAARSRCPRSEIVNDVLLDGMKVVGELFGSGEMQLPFVLQSAETMKAAVALPRAAHGEGRRRRARARSCSRTVKGDVHDIGKNLVDIILTNNGYTVHNLGIKVRSRNSSTRPWSSRPTRSA